MRGRKDDIDAAIDEWRSSRTQPQLLHYLGFSAVRKAIFDEARIKALQLLSLFIRRTYPTVPLISSFTSTTIDVHDLSKCANTVFRILSLPAQHGYMIRFTSRCCDDSVLVPGSQHALMSTCLRYILGCSLFLRQKLVQHRHLIGWVPWIAESIPSESRLLFM